MKTVFVILSIISLMSFLAIGFIENKQYLKNNQVKCLNTVLDLETKEVTATNGCDQNLTFKFAVVSKNSDSYKEIEIQSICLKSHETQTFTSLDIPNYGSFSIFDKEEINC
ncbi:hypothetical protein ABPG74_018985 [Tetrahymena malaccensis]